MQIANCAFLQGKDRYPYPVGYKAVRTHNGMTCKMEIHEGLKGPLFSVCYYSQLFLFSLHASGH